MAGMQLDAQTFPQLLLVRMLLALMPNSKLTILRDQEACMATVVEHMQARMILIQTG